MKITAKTKYALIFMIHLASSYEGDAVASVKEIADKEKIPVKFLEKVVMILKSKDLIHAQRGSKGGYKLSRPPDQIDLKSIFESVQGPIYVPDPDLKRSDSPDQMAVSDLFFRLSEKMAEHLGDQNLADLLRSRQEKNLTAMFYI